MQSILTPLWTTWKQAYILAHKLKKLPVTHPQNGICAGFWPSIIHADDHDRFVRENEQTNQTGEPFNLEYRVIHKDGRVVWLHDLAKLAHDAEGNPLYWHGTLIDITEQKKLQQNIRQSEDRFRKAFQSSPLATCITTFNDGIFLDVNDAYLRLSGFTREQIIGRPATELGFISNRSRSKWIKEL